MPVWHARTEALRKAGRLHVIGIAQEQHADRCLLYARWQGIDWPVAWDPFNITGTQVVPRVTLIDEHGIVRSTRGSLATFEEDFVDKTFPPPDKPVPAPAGGASELVAVAAAKPGSPERAYHEALSALLWPAGRDGETAMHTLQTYAETHPKDAAAQWRLGVAYRMRQDSLERALGDFQQAIQHWRRGLELDPSHYIYRRRIEQYGPLGAKPYPFYPWVDEARRALGDKAPALVAEPTDSERAGRPGEGEGGTEPATRPDTQGADDRVQDGLRIEPTVVWLGDGKDRMAARVHLDIRPAGNRVLLWDAKAGPVTVWVETPGGPLPGGRLLTRRLKGDDRAEEAVAFDFEVDPEDGKGAAFDLEGFVVYHASLMPGEPSKRLLQRFRLRIRSAGA